MPSFRVNLQWATLTEVVPNLYISGVTALKPNELRALNIAMIVNCTNEVPNLKMPEVERIKLWIDDTDDEDIGQHFDILTDRIHEFISSEQRVLVHCVAGVSRSATIVLAYLLKYRCRSLREAYWLLGQTRPMVRPNLGFWRYLISYEQLLKKSKPTVRLVWTKTEKSEDQTLIPDVYMPIVVPNTGDDSSKENGTLEGRQRQGSGQKGKFVPILCSLPEDLILDSISISSESSVACLHSSLESLPCATSSSVFSTTSSSSVS